MEIIDNNQHPQIKHVSSSPGLIMDHAGLRKQQSAAGGGDIVSTHTWYSTPKVVLALWRMAKVQHKFSKGRSTSVSIFCTTLYHIIYHITFLLLPLSFICFIIHCTE